MSKNVFPFEDPNVEAAFAAFPAKERSGLMVLRKLIFDTAQKTDGVGELYETLKWGQPAYLTPKTKSGSTIRLGLPKQGGFAVYAHCQTTILSDFQFIFPNEFAYEGNRAIHFKAGDPLPLDKLEMLVREALTYHL
jgi:hypothetical protein